VSIVNREPRGASYTGGAEQVFLQPKPAPFYGYQPKDILEAIRISSGREQVILVREPRGSYYTAGIEQQYQPKPTEPKPTIEEPETTKPTMPEVLYFKGESQRMDLLRNFEAPFLQIGYSVGQYFGMKTPTMPKTPDFLNPKVSVQSKAGYALGELALLGLATFAVGVGYSEVQSGTDYVSEKVNSFFSEKEVTPGIVDVPDIGYAAPRTMSEKVLGLPELESPYQLKGLQPIEAEKGAMSFGEMPKTALLDPSVESLTRPPAITTEGWTPESVFPYVPRPELTARTPSVFLPSMPSVLISSLTGLPIIPGRPETRTSPRTALKEPTMQELNLNLKQILSPLQSQVSETIQIQQPQLKPIQVLKTDFTKFPSLKAQFETPNPYTPRFDFSISTRKRKGGWEKRYMWEFPVKGPKKIWKNLL
jgi:hypothetical protein